VIFSVIPRLVFLTASTSASKYPPIFLAYACLVNTFRITQIELFQEGPVRIQPIAKFKDAGLHPVMLRNVELCGYEVPTPIQKYCLPAIGLGYDVIGIAQTGKNDITRVLVLSL
jgi:hypothetical protein